MSDTLSDTRIEPGTRLACRMRPGVVGRGKAPCLVRLHGVGSDEACVIDLARSIDPRIIGSHGLPGAMAGDFTQWLSLQLDAPQ